MYFCFRVLYFQKYKKTITFSITFSMLGAPGVYFLYFLSYLGCVGRMVSGFCTILLVRVPPYSSSCWSATTKTLHRVRVETTCRHLRLETLPSSTRCTFSSFLLVLLLPSFDRSSSSSCPLLVRSKACVGSIDRPFVVLLFLSSRRPFVFIVKTSIPLSIAVLFLSWSRRCHDRCGPIDRCFCSHRRVVFVAYTPTPRSIDHA